MPPSNLCRHTPDIAVFDNRGRAVRQLSYHRSLQPDGVTETNLGQRIARATFDTLGRPLSGIDPRLLATGQLPNFTYHSALSGQALHTHSVDAGNSWVMFNAEGRPVWQRDARGTEQDLEYDQLGRMIQRSETLEGGARIVRERWLYGETEAQATERNLRGELSRHYDTAGLLDHSTRGYSLLGAVLRQDRRLLPMGTASDWQDSPPDETALELAVYTSSWQQDALGQTLLQVDARAHQQRYRYDLAGRLKTSTVTLNVPLGTEQTVLSSLSYSAAGQKLREEAGNGIVTAYGYEPATQRLISVRTTRPGGAVLQQLHYTYDPVGNITAIRDDTVETHHFRNTRSDGSKTFAYDSLYQLIEATGRENATANNGTDNPAAESLTSDTFVPYARRYAYDAGGNLTEIQHQGAALYTRRLTVAATSNHACREMLGLTARDVHSQFDACGNQTRLDTGQTLQWNGRNQLQAVTTVARTGGLISDSEHYQYGGDGMRVRKLTQAQTRGTVQQQEVIYLPGLELRQHGAAMQTPLEELEVICIGQAGRSQVRVLHWAEGKPAEETNIPNDQLRYSLDDHLGSSQLEFDGAAQLLTREEYYPYGGTAVRSAQSVSEVKYKTIRYSGKERDASGLYYYGYRYYQPWLGRWLNPDPAETVDGLNLYRMVRNNPIQLRDEGGLFAFPGADPRLSARYQRKKIHTGNHIPVAQWEWTDQASQDVLARQTAGGKPHGICKGIASAWVIAFLNKNPDSTDQSSYEVFFENFLRHQATFIKDFGKHLDTHITTMDLYHGTNIKINNIINIPETMNTPGIKKQDLPGGDRWGAYLSVWHHDIAIGGESRTTSSGKVETKYYINEPNTGLLVYTRRKKFLADLNGYLESRKLKKNPQKSGKAFFAIHV